MLITSLFRQKLLDRRKDHAARVHVKLRPHIGPALRLHRRLAQKFLTP